jgi:hypothetical protein
VRKTSGTILEVIGGFCLIISAFWIADSGCQVVYGDGFWPVIVRLIFLPITETILDFFPLTPIGECFPLWIRGTALIGAAMASLAGEWLRRGDGTQATLGY